MNEVIMDQDIVSFDGRVLEIFILHGRGDTKRYHIALLQKIELKSIRNGQQMEIEYSKHKIKHQIRVPDEAVDAIQVLIAEVQAKMS